MKFTLDNGQTIDTDSLRPEERHIIQKLLAWQSLVNSVAHFRTKKKEALMAGWNDSGPVHETPALSLVIRQMEQQVRNRLKQSTT